MNCAYCEHPSEEHNLSWGRCAGESHDPDYGRYACVCPHFEVNSDA
jgi:hypothetical protein